MALEQLKKQEAELKQMMIYQGRPGMWQDWLRFQVEARQRREQTEKERIRLEVAKRQKRMEYLINTFYTAVIFASLYVIYWMGELIYILTKGSK
jgi:hypothetical protein